MTGIALGKQLLIPVVDGKPTTSMVSLVGSATDVACLGPSSCLAVGGGNDGKGLLQWVISGKARKPLVLRGSEHSVTPAGVACGTTACTVVGLECCSARSAAIGILAIVTPSSVTATATPIRGASDLNGVACPSQDLCFAVGDAGIATGSPAIVVPIVLGKAKAPQRAANSTHLSGISCGSHQRCWAAGNTMGRGAHNVIVSYEKNRVGPNHPIPKSPNPDGAIACVSSSICFYTNATSTYGNGEILELVNGSLVKRYVIPTFDYGSLTGIDCPTAKSCLAVGPTSFHPGYPSYYTSAVVSFTIQVDQSRLVASRLK